MDDDAIRALTEKLAHGRAASVAELRALANTLERLPLAEAAEGLVLIEPAFDELRRWAKRAGLQP